MRSFPAIFMRLERGTFSVQSSLIVLALLLLTPAIQFAGLSFNRPILLAGDAAGDPADVREDIDPASLSPVLASLD